MVKIEQQAENGDIYLKSIKSGREVRVTEKFNALLNENPEIIADFLAIDAQLMEKKHEDGEKFFSPDGKLTVTVIGHAREDAWGKRENQYRGYYLKADFIDASGNQKSFFIKTMPGNYNTPEKSMGATEFDASAKAKKLVESSGISNVEVVNFQLGYENKRDNRTYFFSDWTNGVRLKEYLEQMPNTDERRDPLKKRYDKISSLLFPQFHDMFSTNMLYDEDSDKIILFDFMEKESFLKRK